MTESDKIPNVKNSTVRKLVNAINGATTLSLFAVEGKMPIPDPGLVIDGLGKITFPVSAKSIQAMLAASHIAPYGLGTQTLVNRDVRKTSELNAAQFQLSHDWEESINKVVKNVAIALQLPEQDLEAHIYKLLIYQKGDFFLPHRDSEKVPGMIASLVVVLPNRFSGGKLTIEHNGKKQTFHSEYSSYSRQPTYVAFYSDCLHSVEPVKSGCRIVLTYNLALKSRKATLAKKPKTESEMLSQAMKLWFQTKPNKPLIFALDHQYTEHGLQLDLLKGADRQLVELVQASAKNCDCKQYFTQVTYHACYDAMDDDLYRSRRSGQSSKPRNLGEVIVDEVHGEPWFDLDGNKQDFPSILLDHHAIVSNAEYETWEMSKENYEGYTGNSGATLDRWYHRSAIVVWPREQHFHVMTSYHQPTVQPGPARILFGWIFRVFSSQ